MTHKERRAKVYHADLWGLRDDKYAWLQGHDWKTTDWQEIRPVSEFYLFAPQDADLFERYNRYVKVTDIFPVNSVGIVTSRDAFVLDFDKDALERRIRTFLDPSLPDDVVQETFSLRDTSGWKISAARQALRGDATWKKALVPCLYRPFDKRWLFYHPTVIERGREEVMRHMLACENVALIVPRQNKGDFGAFVTYSIGAHKTVAAFDINFYFPLYFYPETEREDLLSPVDPQERRPNINPALPNALAQAYDEKPSPEQIFYYIYAVLYAPTYREKYAEFLRLDFPRIPFTSDPELFKKMAELGKRLVDLHLLRSQELDPPIARFQGEGGGKVETGKKGLRYDAERERVYINQSQYFEGVPSEVWEYQIGGYQVCQKWLKDRKAKKLTLDDIRTYCRITTALFRTIHVQAMVDTCYIDLERGPVVASGK